VRYGKNGNRNRFELPNLSESVIGNLIPGKPPPIFSAMIMMMSMSGMTITVTREEEAAAVLVATGAATIP
jgi:hypothetical protein